MRNYEGSYVFVHMQLPHMRSGVQKPSFVTCDGRCSATSAMFRKAQSYTWSPPDSGETSVKIKCTVQCVDVHLHRGTQVAMLAPPPTIDRLRATRRKSALPLSPRPGAEVNTAIIANRTAHSSKPTVVQEVVASQVPRR